MFHIWVFHTDQGRFYRTHKIISKFKPSSCTSKQRKDCRFKTRHISTSNFDIVIEKILEQLYFIIGSSILNSDAVTEPLKQPQNLNLVFLLATRKKAVDFKLTNLLHQTVA